MHVNPARQFPVRMKPVEPEPESSTNRTTTTSSSTAETETSELIGDVFDTCQECGRFLNPRGSQHTCAATQEHPPLVPSDRREHRDIRIEADHGDPSRDVLTLNAGGHHAAYHRHEADETGEPDTVCTRNLKAPHHEYVVMTRGEAQRRGRFPCGACYPDVAERAARMHAERQNSDDEDAPDQGAFPEGAMSDD